jgi:glucose/arabinose dehydrogenase/predicted lipoprotein with Yx(FWY)xxD motif
MSRTRWMPYTFGLLLALALALYTTAGEAWAQADGSAAVQLGTTEELGSFLVDGEGMSLYLFMADEPGSAVSTCYDQCAEAWPPLLSEGMATAEDVNADLLGTLERDDGSMQVTYNGWPLYYFVRDQQPGDTMGHEIEGFGAEWYLVTPEGEALHAEAEAEQTGGMMQEAGGLGSAVQPEGTLPGEPSIQLVKVADGLIDPVNVAAPADGSNRIFIVERTGTIRILQDGELLDEPFLDISDTVRTGFLEQGLLGLAFHPNYSENGRFFVYYIDYRTNGDSVLAEFQVSDGDANVADPESARVLLTHDQPFINHNGGNLTFGPDGYLYLSLGDGGLAGDPYRNAQDLSNILGSIIRIDVDADVRRGYAIPEDNPFSGMVLYSPTANNEAQDGGYIPDAAPEIWVYGLRNPWEFSFDRETGDLYIADVGQNEWEEINFVAAGEQGGQNFGWPDLEASHCYVDENCTPTGVLPVAEYANPEPGCSITGIGVYRGGQSTTLDGIYFSSDFCSGKVWGLTRNDQNEWLFAELLDTELLVTGAGEGEDGELYVAACNCQFGRNYDPFANPGGTLWRIVQSDQVPEGAETAPLAP